MLTFGCATAEAGTGDPYGRPLKYLRDPPGWAHDCFAQARERGFGWVRFHKPDGHDGTPLYKAGVFRDQDAMDAVCEETEAGDIKVCLYTGKVNPQTGNTLHAADPFLRTFAQQWIDCGLARVEWDNTADVSPEYPDQQGELGAWCASKGMASAGEWYPIMRLSGGQVILTSKIRTSPWVILHDSAMQLDPRGLWRVNPAATELRQLVYAPHFATVDDAAAYVRRVKAGGQIADQLETEGWDARVTAEILRG